MTPILKVITQYCSVLIDDINLETLANENMPVYAWRMWAYFQAAIPLFTTPSTVVPYLVGTGDNPKLIEPKYSNYKYTAADDITSDEIINLDDNGIGHELFCCHIQTYDKIKDEIIMLPTSVAKYDNETGTITLTASEENPIPKGTIFDMDFYTDGYFKEDLSVEIMRILGMCFQIIWQTRFNNNWLSNIPKIEDRSFSEQNRANKMKADTERLKGMKNDLHQAMNKLEQNLAFRKTVLPLRYSK